MGARTGTGTGSGGCTGSGGGRGFRRQRPSGTRTATRRRRGHGRPRRRRRRRPSVGAQKRTRSSDRARQRYRRARDRARRRHRGRLGRRFRGIGRQRGPPAAAGGAITRVPVRAGRSEKPGDTRRLRSPAGSWTAAHAGHSGGLQECGHQPGSSRGPAARCPRRVRWVRRACGPAPSRPGRPWGPSGPAGSGIRTIWGEARLAEDVRPGCAPVGCAQAWRSRPAARWPAARPEAGQ